MRRLFATCLFALTAIVAGCTIRSVDYAVGDVQLISKTQTTVAGKPAVALVIANRSSAAVYSVVVTVKAKRRQLDVDVETVTLAKLAVAESVERTVVLRKLRGHGDYDLLTYAVSFSK